MFKIHSTINVFGVKTFDDKLLVIIYFILLPSKFETLWPFYLTLYSVHEPSPRRPKWRTINYVGRLHDGLIMPLGQVLGRHTPLSWHQYIDDG